MSLTDAMPPPITISPGVRPSIPMLVGAAHLVHRLVVQGSDFERTFTRKFDAFAWRIFGLMIAQFALIAGLYLK